MAKTIQILLPDGDPDGVKVAEITGKMAKAYVLPKHMLSYAQIQPGLRSAALYFLFSEDRIQVYIGACSNFAVDGVSEISKKDFWKTVIICTAPGGRLESADTVFLRSHAIKKAGKLKILNTEALPETKINDFKLPVVLSLFADFELILSTLGFL